MLKLAIMVDKARIVRDFAALYPAELLERYAAGERDFHGINLLRAEIEALADEIDFYDPPSPGIPFGYWKETVSPLWVDRRTAWEPLFHWEGNGFEPLLEATWEEKEDWPDIEETDLSGRDLSDINLQGAYLYRVNLTGATLRGAKFQAAVLIEVDLSAADLEKADFRESVAPGVKLNNANLKGARIERAMLRGADLSSACLTRARLRRANLSLTSWSGAILSATRFSRNNLNGADFRDLDFANAKLADATVYGCLIAPEQEAPFLDALEISRDRHAPRRSHVWLPTP